MAERLRLDTLLVERGLARSREHAKAMIMAGQAVVGDHRAEKPSQLVSRTEEIRLKNDPHPYVSRGGVKLEGALDDLKLDVAGLHVLDIGASTGGFTHCLLLRGAAAVTAVDVGYGQMALSLRDDPRVHVLERQNARYLTEELVGGKKDMAVVDVSFIGLDKILPAVSNIIKPKGLILALVKPQFEVGKGQVGKGGVVRDEKLRELAVERVKQFAEKLGLKLLNEAPSRLPGPKGNIEHFVCWRKD